MIIKVYNNQTISQGICESVSQLLHESFAERRAQGIDFKCGTFSAQDVKNAIDRSGGGYLLVAEEDEKIIGTVSFIKRDKGGYKYASHDNLGVSNVYKGHGVARALFGEFLRIAKENKLDFITSCTATKAESSILYHLKMGFVIWGKSYSKGYNSYSFIYPIKKFRLLRYAPFRWIVYAIKTGIGFIKK